MSTPDPNSSQQAENPAPKKKIEKSTPSQTAPLASPDEPTRAYPTDSSRTYSSDPSQYSTGHSTSEKPPHMHASEPIDSGRMGGEDRRTIENEAKKEPGQQAAGRKKSAFTDRKSVV